MTDEKRPSFRLIVLESPFAGDIERNMFYARLCVRDCLRRGEAPIVSHLLFTQPGILRDEVPEERRLGIEAGLAWVPKADVTAAYVDFGTSRGMAAGMERALEHGKTVECRYLPTDLLIGLFEKFPRCEMEIRTLRACRPTAGMFSEKV